MKFSTENFKRGGEGMSCGKCGSKKKGKGGKKK
jgi:hypothetical protein